MAVRLTEGRTVAKRKAGRPKTENPRGKGKQVRLDPDLVAKADIVARRRGLDVGPFLSNLMETPINREYAAVLRELAKIEEGSK